MGHIERRIVEESYLRRSRLPDRILNAPQLRLGLELYYGAFSELSSCRTTGFGAGPIPWSVVQDYADTFVFDDEQTEALHYLIRKMDSAYLDHVNRPKAT